MRFQQVKRSTKNILRKESIKNWVVKSALGLVGGLVLFGVSQSTVTQAATDTSEQPSSSEIAPETVTNESEPTGEISGNWGVDWKFSDGTLQISGGKLNNTHYAEGAADNTNQWGNLNKENVTKIVFDGKVTAGTSISGLFNMFTNVTEISGLDKFDTSNTTDMSYAFANDNVRTEIDVSSMDVSKVSNFSGMFYQNFSLQNLDISKWNWSSGIDFHDMFSNCVSLETLELPSVSNTSGPDSDFSRMFSYDKLLGLLDLSNLDMSNTDKVDNFLMGSRNISTLILSSKNNLTNAQVEIKPENDGDPTMGISGWKKDGNPDINANNEELTTMYDGKKDNGKVATWTWNYQPYISFTIRYVDEDDGSLITTREITSSNKVLPFSKFKPAALIAIGSTDSGHAIQFEPESVTLTKDIEGKSINVKIPKAAIKFVVYENGKRVPSDIIMSNDNIVDGKVDFKGQLDVLKNKKLILADSETFDKSKSYFDLLGNSINITEDLLTKMELTDYSSYSDIIQGLANSLVDEGEGTIPTFYEGGKVKFYAVYEPEKNTNSGGSSSSGGSSTTTVNREVKGIEEKIGTHNNNPDVQLYDDNGDIVKDRKLAPSSDWYTDNLMTLKGVKYYRVATDLWAKADDVYIYYPSTANVLVNKGSIARLVTSQGKDVTDRALLGGSGWYTDRYTYINDTKYYRVATNEFVSVDKVQEY